MAGELLTPKGARELMGLGRSAFYNHEKAGKFRQLQIARPVGRFRYSRKKVEQFVSGQSLARVS